MATTAETTPQRRLFLLKAYAYLSYALGVIGMSYNAMLMATMNLPVSDFFLLTVICVVVGLVAQNTLMRFSDRIANRKAFLYIDNILTGIGTLFIAFFPNFPVIIVAGIMTSLISGESTLNVIVYELVDMKRATLDPQSDAFEAYNKSKEFSKYRIFGSMGFAFTAPFGGYLITVLDATFPRAPYFGYTVAYAISGIGTLLLNFFLWYILKGYASPAHISTSSAFRATTTPLQPSPATPSRPFYLKIAFWMLIITSLMFNAGDAIRSNPFTKYIESLGAMEWFYGLLMFVWATAELPMFFLSSYLVKRYNWRLLVLLSFFLQEARLLVYAAVATPSLLYMIVMVQVLTPFGISFPAKTYALTNEIGGTDRKALSMALNDTMGSVGTLVGGIVGLWMAVAMGPVANTMQGYMIFFVMAMLVTLATIVVFVVLMIAEKSRVTRIRVSFPV